MISLPSTIPNCPSLILSPSFPLPLFLFLYPLSLIERYEQYIAELHWSVSSLLGDMAGMGRDGRVLACDMHKRGMTFILY